MLAALSAALAILALATPSLHRLAGLRLVHLVTKTVMMATALFKNNDKNEVCFSAIELPLPLMCLLLALLSMKLPPMTDPMIKL